RLRPLAEEKTAVGAPSFTPVDCDNELVIRPARRATSAEMLRSTTGDQNRPRCPLRRAPGRPGPPRTRAPPAGLLAGSPARPPALAHVCGRADPDRTEEGSTDQMRSR